MPELPDVETFRRYVEATSLDQPIVQVHIAEPALLQDVSPRSLRRTLVPHRFVTTRRHGKHLLVRLDNGAWLALHFGMSGELACFRSEQKTPPYSRVILDFDKGNHLAYVSPRKLGHISLARDPQEFIARKRLGPDALALDRRTFRELARDSRGSVKAWLMNQEAIAGIGNIYSDEILFQARLQPKRALDSLSDADLGRLFNSLRKVLTTAIAAKADPAAMPRGFLLPRREKGGRCPHCGMLLGTMRAGGRTCYFCTRCQR